MSVERRGLMLVLSSPSGAGKTTLSRELLASDAAISLSVSVTTRAPRPGEVDGVDYRFVSQEAFSKLRDDGELLEWAQVFDNHYGTPRAEVEDALSKGRDVLFDIDWQGAQQLSQRMAQDLVRVFILPPSGQALRARLENRRQDSADVISRRMMKAAQEISHWAEYDYVLINDDVSATSRQLGAILEAERVKRVRQVGLTRFVRDVIAEL